MSDIIVHIDSCLVSADGDSMLVSATLPDGRHVINASIPAQPSREALATYLMTTAPSHRIMTGYTGNVSIPAPVVEEAVEDASDATPAAPASDATPADAAPVAKATKK